MASPSKGTVLLTGLQGFTGGYLGAVLRSAGYRVVGIVSGEPHNPDEYRLDIRDGAAVRSVVDQVAPDYAVHLAAISFVAHGDAGEIYDVNLKGTLHLVEALAAQPKRLRKLLVASSGNIYGAAAGAAPVGEDLAPQPLNHYGVSKCAAEQAVLLQRERVPAVLARPFNYTGIGQAANFVIPKLVAAFRRGERRLKLGDIDTVRDFSDVRWMVQAYLQLLESPFHGGPVNVCSGRGTRVRDVLAALEAIAGYRMEVETDAALLRANEIPCLVGSPAKLEGLVQVPARPSFAETLEWMFRT